MDAKSNPNTEPREGGVLLKGLEKRFGDVVAVRDFTLKIEEGEMLVLLGPSGCGKTTTLNMVAGLEEPTKGEIYFGSTPITQVPPEKRNISMVFQSIALYPHLNARENISFAMRLQKLPHEEIQRRLMETTKLLHIEEYLDRRIHELSGGERQRVAIAKALVKRPRLFLLDEPFSNVDAAMRREFRTELVRIHGALGTTTLFVTHDQEEAMSIADRIALMNKGELVQCGPPLDIYNQPATLWASTFVGTHPINVIECTVSDGVVHLFKEETLLLDVVPENPRLKSTFKAAAGKRTLLAVRPEFVLMDEGPSTAHRLEAKVLTRQVLGSDILYELVLAKDKVIRALTSASRQYEVGATVMIRFGWDDVFFFDEATGKPVV